MENESDMILSGASQMLNKNKKVLKYDNNDPENGETPNVPVDYSKAQIDIDTLIEPLSLTMTAEEYVSPPVTDSDVELTV